MNLIADHLWQSTLFAGVVLLLTLALRKNRARVRHWLWSAASIKFFIRFLYLSPWAVKSTYGTPRQQYLPTYTL
jgi:hypothetical protein